MGCNLSHSNETSGKLFLVTLPFYFFSYFFMFCCNKRKKEKKEAGEKFHQLNYLLNNIVASGLID